MTLPAEFVKMLEWLGLEYAALPETLTATRPETAVRINRAKTDRYGVSLSVIDGARPVEWCADGFILPERPPFTLDPALHQGLYYVQDASSMAVCAAVSKAIATVDTSGRPLRYLDACAAPGGKTTAALNILPRDAFVVANEYDSRRASILVENLSKWGVSAAVTVGSAADPWKLPRFFDVIAADVPCSGEGMMRKDPQAVEQWSPGLVESCARLQHEIVDSLWEALAPGGVLIYSTCTFNVSENEEIIKHLVSRHGAEPIAIPALELEGVLGVHSGYDFPAYHFLPGLVPGEGQFVAMVRKPADQVSGKIRLPRDVRRPAKDPGWLDGEYVYSEEKNGILNVVPAAHQTLIAAVGAARRLRQAGIEVATVKGRDLIPSQPLAMARDLRSDAFPIAEVDQATALEYLRRQAIVLPSDAPRGHVMLMHGGAPLGFVKNLGTRTNNLYPAAWRILK